MTKDIDPTKIKGAFFTSGRGAACHPNDPNNVSWWGQGGRIEHEKTKRTTMFALRHLEEPDWSKKTDWLDCEHPYFRLGRRGPFTNNSCQMARLLHTGCSENFPAPDGDVENFPGYPFNNAPDGRQMPESRVLLAKQTYEKAIKPNNVNPGSFLKDAESCVGSALSAGAKSSAASRLSRCRSVPASVCTASTVSTATSLSLPASKLKVTPYVYAALPGTRYYEQSKKLMDKYDHELASETFEREDQLMKMAGLRKLDREKQRSALIKDPYMSVRQ